MKYLSRTAFRPLTCPFCESGRLVTLGINGVWCDACAYQMRGAALRALRRISRLPDALGAHPCECGHPAIRRLPDGVFHCPACRSEVLPIETRGVGARRKGRRWLAT